MIIRFYVTLNLLLCLSGSALAQQFTQENVADVIVNGVELSNPFAGGLNAPQLSNVDFNNDGISDVLVFDRIGNVILPMIRDGEGYTYNQSYIENFPKIENFLLMKDYNKDGIADIFCHSTEPGVPGVSVYKGKYTNDKIDFDLFTYPNYQFQVLNYELSNGSFSNIAVSNIDIPSFEDIDSDGDLDIVTFNFLGGYIEYYQNLVVERGESLDGFYFAKVDDCYGGVHESGASQVVDLSSGIGECSEMLVSDNVTVRHTGSTLLSLDFDADGDYELLLGDLSYDNITLLENDGNADEAWFSNQIIHYPESEPVDITIFPAAFYLDIDGDNVKDFVAAPNNINNSFDTDNVWYYRNAGADNNPIFGLTKKDLFVESMIDLGTGTSPAFADINADGLMDMVVGTNTKFVEFGERDGRLHLFLNVGTIEAPAFELVDDNWLDFQRFNSDAYDFTPTFADLDSDGDLDLFTGERNGNIYFAENIAGAGEPMSFSSIVPNYLDLDVGILSYPIFYDLNKDGLLDLVAGERNGNVNYFQNIGTATSPKFDVIDSENPSPFIIEILGKINTNIESTIVGYSKPTIINYQGDDVIITGTGHGALEMYKVNSDLSSEFELLDDNLGNLQVGAQIAPSFVDLNGDGMYELVVGNLRGGLNSYTTDMSSTPVSTENNLGDNSLRLRSNLVLNSISMEDDLAAEMAVYTMLGQEILFQAGGVRLDVSSLDAGIYFVALKRGDQRSTRKFVKQ